MTPILWGAAALAVAYLPLSPRDPGLLRSVVKTGSVALLAIAAVLAQAPAALWLALALCALGDWFLSRDGDTAFMAGVGAFAAGHIAYVVLFLGNSTFDASRLATVPQAVIAVALLALGLVMARLLASRAGDLRLPVLCYIPIIMAMGLAALGLARDGALVWALPAALAFIASDFVLAVEKFLLPGGHPALRWTPFAVWPLYWGAQAGFFAAFG